MSLSSLTAGITPIVVYQELQGSSLTCGHFLLAPLSGNLQGSMAIIVLRVRPTPTRFPTSILYTHLCVLYQACDDGLLHSKSQYYYSSISKPIFCWKRHLFVTFLSGIEKRIIARITIFKKSKEKGDRRDLKKKDGRRMSIKV